MIAGRKRRHAAAVESTFAEPSQCKLNGLKGKSEVNIVKRKKRKGVLINKKRQNEARRQKKKKREKRGKENTVRTKRKQRTSVEWSRGTRLDRLTTRAQQRQRKTCPATTTLLRLVTSRKHYTRTFFFFAWYGYALLTVKEKIRKPRELTTITKKQKERARRDRLKREKTPT